MALTHAHDPQFGERGSQHADISLTLAAQPVGMSLPGFAPIDGARIWFEWAHREWIFLRYAAGMSLAYTSDQGCIGSDASEQWRAPPCPPNHSYKGSRVGSQRHRYPASGAWWSIAAEAVGSDERHPVAPTAPMLGLACRRV